MTKLREMRKEKGWSLTLLTAKTLIGASDLSQIELGHRTCFPGWRKRLAKAFKCSEQEIFGNDFSKPEKR